MCIMRYTFIHRDVMKVFPWIKARTLISWSERGLIEPVSNAAGRGSSRVYSYANLIEIGIISQFLQHGIPFPNIEAIMKSPPIKKLIKMRDFNVVIWSDRQPSGACIDRAPGSISGTNAYVKGIPAMNTGTATMNIPTYKTHRSASLKVFELISSVGYAKYDDFLKDGGRLLMGEKKNITSVVVVNVKAIKSIVDDRIQNTL